MSVAIAKGEKAVRPLSVNELPYVLAGKYLMRLMAPEFPSLFPSIQVACGVSGGSANINHAAQAALEGKDSPVVVNTDAVNAFNTRPLATIAAALLANPSTKPLWRFFFTYYVRGAHMGVYSKGKLRFSFTNTRC